MTPILGLERFQLPWLSTDSNTKSGRTRLERSDSSQLLRVSPLYPNERIYSNRKTSDSHPYFSPSYELRTKNVKYRSIILGLQHYVITGGMEDGLPLDEKLLSEYLKELGYATHMVGKWHLGHARHLYTPTYRGFDSHYGNWLGAQDYYDHFYKESVSSGLHEEFFPVPTNNTLLN